MKKSYVLIQDFKAPYVIATGMPHKPSKIMLKRYVKGEIITGELKTAKGKPVIVLVNGVIPVPITMLKEVVTKEIVNSVNGKPDTTKVTQTQGSITIKKTNTRYLDAGILGAILGVGAVYLAEKQGWIAQIDKKNKLYGAGIGAALAMYIIYRKK